MAPRRQAGKRRGRSKSSTNNAEGGPSRLRRRGASAERGAVLPRLVVGLGASAGGLDAFRTFFAHMPAESGIAFVLVQHLDPDYKSALVELLRAYARMPVALAEEGMAIAADQVYVIPPNAVLSISDSILHVSKPAPPREQRKPIDLFFSSLAADQTDKAVCIILSGSGSDGSAGLKAVKEHGGFSLAQAGFDETALLGMPSSAVATGLVDEIMPVERMPERLLAHAEHLDNLDLQKDDDGTLRNTGEYLSRIFALLRARVGHDFSEYKDKTVIRRIQRRMQVLQIDSVPEYVERLRKDPAQLDLLFRDLLIGVTQFFRDPGAFAALQTQIIAKLLDSKATDDQIRVWVPGCTTGEEAYSIAMLLQEAMVECGVAPKVQIFATDLDEQAIALARHGRYRLPLSGISPERLARWFTTEDDGASVVKTIREMCIYSQHDLVRDAPFSRLDLISCRNLMIYLNAALQERLIRTFHYALRPGGYLFLGAAEGVARQIGLFTMLDKRHRLFQRRDDVRASLPGGVSAALPAQPGALALAPARVVGTDVDAQARHAMEKYAPTYIVINRQHEVLRFSGRSGNYIEHPPGAASLNLFRILRKDLLPAVRSAVQSALATRQAVAHDDLVVEVSGGSKVVTLFVEPLAGPSAEMLYVVGFQDRGFVHHEDAKVGLDAAAGARVNALEEELRASRTQLQTTIDDLETANEELKSSNEEYQSVNEEFQSANEELESAKEELQSINEELNTINAELASKNEALAEANSDLKNLLDSTQIPTLFLDVDLRIKNFTPAIADVFRLRAGDRGRPIADIVPRLRYDNLKSDAAKVLRDLSFVEREVTAIDGDATFLMRLRPYRTLGDVIGGVVITFVDITERKRQEERTAKLAAIVELSDDAIFSMDLEGTVLSWNGGAMRLLGFTADDIVGKPITTLYPPDRLGEAADILALARRGERIDHHETMRRRRDGASVAISLSVSPIRDGEGRVIGASKIVRDISERKRGENLRTLMVDELNHRVKNTLATVQSIAAQSLKGVDVLAREAFAARLVALAKTHDLLAREHWERAPLRDVLQQELEPYHAKDGPHVVLEGPAVELSPKAALALGIAFHELSTNAAKYGALSTLPGRVRVTWEVGHASQPVLRLTWAESGGPPLAQIGKRGFGSTLLERGLSLELDGAVAVDFASGGLICTMEIPLDASRKGGA